MTDMHCHPDRWQGQLGSLVGPVDLPLYQSHLSDCTTGLSLFKGFFFLLLHPVPLPNIGGDSYGS